MQKQSSALHGLLARLLTGLLISSLTLPALAAVSAYLDRNKIYEGDPVTLTITSDDRKAGEPDLSPLNKDFKVLGNSTSSQVSIINGRRSDKTSWSVQLEPRQLGKFRIPPLQVGNEKTRALDLEVTELPEQVAAQQSEHLFIEIEADHKGPAYIQQQIPYTVRLYYDDQVISGDLTEPQPENAVVEQLGDDKQYSVTRNGRHYNVLERHYAISPEKSGSLRIPPVTFKGQLVDTQSRSASSSLNDPFFDRFFRNSPFRHAGKPVRIHSQALTVDVQSRPASAGKNWLPAEQISLQDSWTGSPPQFRAGEPVSRTITLQAKGLTGAQLPMLQLKEPAQTRLYPETPVNESRTDGDKVYGISKQTFTYIPGKAGALTIPAIKLQWWNTRTNQLDTSSLPRWEVHVEAGTGVTTQTRPADTAENRSQSADQDNPAPESPVQPAVSWPDHIKAFKHWPALVVTLLVMMIAWLSLRRYRHSKSAAPVAKSPKPVAQNSRILIKKLTAELADACTANNAGTAAHTLLELGRARWPEDPPGNLGVLADRLGQGSEHIMALDRALYAADTSTWNGAELWAAIKDAWHEDSREKKPVEEGLQPLYPHSA